LQLGVHEDNARALAFYGRHGFADTGRREAYPLDASRKEIIMERPLSVPAP
jgi:ribosomal protein S18 acetylase RimI-like enzyme